MYNIMFDFVVCMLVEVYPMRTLWNVSNITSIFNNITDMQHPCNRPLSIRKLFGSITWLFM